MMEQSKQALSLGKTQAYIELRRLIDGFRYKDSKSENGPVKSAVTDSFDIELGYKTQYLSLHSPESRILESWYDYLGAVIVEAEPKNLKDAVENTETERLEYLETLEFFMKSKPTGEDLKELLNLPEKYNEVIENINEDIKKLLK